MEGRPTYEDYTYPVVFLSPYENPLQELGFNIRGGKASQFGIFISKVIPDSDAHRAGLQEGDQVLTVNNVDFQDIEHSTAGEGNRKTGFTAELNETPTPSSSLSIQL
ncbi:PDZ domain-containing protein 11-like [Lithobates pipiens]